MLRIILLIILNFSIFSQNINVFHKNNINEYIDTLKNYSQSTLYSLNGTWLFKAPKEIKWQRVTIPSSYQNAKKLLFKRNFKLNKQDRKNKLILHILGINNEAVIKINGEAVATYFYNGAPYQVELDKSKLYFEQRNTIEILVDNQLNYESSFPRKAIFTSPAPYGGITKDIYIESVPNRDIYNIDYNSNSKLLSMSFLENFEDSLSITTFNLNFKISDISGKNFNISKRVYGDKLKRNRYSINLLLEKPKRLNINFNSDIHIEISGNKKVQKKEAEALYYKFYFPKEIKDDHLYIISKIEQYPEKNNQADLEEIETDVQKILDLGFNGIFFPYDYPHPYYFILAKKLKFKIFISLPLYSLTNEQINKEQTKTYIKNYINLKHPENTILVLPSLYQNNTLELIADSLNLSYYNSNSLKYNGKEIIASGYIQGEMKNYNGFQNEYSEEYQSKLFKDFITAEKPQKNLLINTFSDFNTDISLLIQKKIGDLKLSQTGLFNTERQEKKSARDIKTLLNTNRELSLNPGDKFPKEEHSFIILGIFVLALFVIGFKQAVRLSDNLKRAFFHAHGFFTDTRERRILYMGQSFFLLFLFLMINGNILATLLYYNRENTLFNVLLNYILSREYAYFILNLSDNAYYLQGFSISLVLIFIIFASIFTKLVSSLAGKRMNFKQSLTIVIWSMTPVLFLIPVSMFLYNILIFNMMNQFIAYAIVFMYLWAFLRWLNGTRVISDSSHLKVLLLTFTLSSIIVLSSYGLLEYFRNVSEYLEYFKYLTKL